MPLAIPAVVTSLFAAVLAAVQAPQIRIQTALVQVPTVVTDRQGRYVPDLQPGDFALLDDGLPQPIAFFATSQEPVRVALLLDTSKSTVTVLGDIRKAAAGFLGELRPQDQAVVVSFDAAVHVLQPLTGSREDLKEAIRNARPGEYVGTRLRDAVSEVTEKRFKSVTGRKAIILLSDGQDYGSEVTAPDLLASIGASNTVVYPVLYTVDPRDVMRKLFGVKSRLPRERDARSAGDRKWREREQEAEEFMRRLAAESAGSLHRIELTDLKKTFAGIANELRSQYWLGFYPEKSRNDGAPQRLEVRVAREGVGVRHRMSYRIR